MQQRHRRGPARQLCLGRSNEAESEREGLETAVDRVLAELGEMPGVDRPSERALYVAALLNPCGGEQARRWPAMEVRGAVLRASTPLERLSVTKTALVDSIYKLKGGKWPMNTYYW